MEKLAACDHEDDLRRSSSCMQRFPLPPPNRQSLAALTNLTALQLTMNKASARAPLLTE